MDPTKDFDITKCNEPFSGWKITFPDVGPEIVINDNEGEVIRFVSVDDIVFLPYPEGEEKDETHNFGKPSRLRFSGIITFPIKDIGKKINGFYYAESHCGYYSAK
jgi:hypothetical protein